MPDPASASPAEPVIGALIVGVTPEARLIAAPPVSVSVFAPLAAIV